MPTCENCHEQEATVQARDMKGSTINLCADCAKSVQGAEVLKIEE